MGRRRYSSWLYDSSRWDDFEVRPGDIIVCTPPKCGTTWAQMICALLVLQDPRLPAPLSSLSPWLDMADRPRAEVFARLEGQAHRRFYKTHTPLDGLPADPRATYVCVGRDPRDVAVSMETIATTCSSTGSSSSVRRPQTWSASTQDRHLRRGLGRRASASGSGSG